MVTLSQNRVLIGALLATFLSAVCISLSVGCQSGESGGEMLGPPGTVVKLGGCGRELEYVPVITLRRNSRTPVRFCIVNTSGKPMGVWKDMPTVAYESTCTFRLYRCATGERISPTESAGYELAKESVVILQPQESYVCELKVTEQFGMTRKSGRLPLGLYELRAVWEVREDDGLGKIGVKAMSATRTVCFVEVVE